MKVIRKCLILLVCALFLQSCFFYAAYGVYRTIRDINSALAMVNNAMTNVRTVLAEGKELKRAAEDGKLITSLAEKIPTLIQNQVEQAAANKINALSGDLKLSSIDFTQNAVAENLTGARHAYNDMAGTYNRFADLMSDLSETAALKN
jgi:hypothetical protein